MSYRGCQEDWKTGNNVTLEILKQQQKHKGHGIVYTMMTKMGLRWPFLFFLSPPEIPADEDPNAAAEAILATDFKTGHSAWEHRIQRSLLHFPREPTDDDGDNWEEGDLWRRRGGGGKWSRLWLKEGPKPSTVQAALQQDALPCASLQKTNSHQVTSYLTHATVYYGFKWVVFFH